MAQFGLLSPQICACNLVGADPEPPFCSLLLHSVSERCLFLSREVFSRAKLPRKKPAERLLQVCWTFYFPSQTLLSDSCRHSQIAFSNTIRLLLRECQDPANSSGESAECRFNCAIRIIHGCAELPKGNGALACSEWRGLHWCSAATAYIFKLH